MFLHVSVIHSVHRGGGKYLTQVPPRADTPLGPGIPPGTRYTLLGPGTPPKQTPLPGPGTPGADTPHRTRSPPEQTPPGTRYTPWSRHPPGTRYSPRSRNPPNQVHPPGPGTPPRPGTPPGPGTSPWTRYTPLDQVHTPDQSMLGDTVNVWAVRILLECNLVTSNGHNTGRHFSRMLTAFLPAVHAS